MRRLLALAALLVVVPVVAQEDAGVYFALNSNKTFAPGETMKSITITIKPDSLDEDNEKFHVVLGSPTNATLAARSCTTAAA